MIIAVRETQRARVRCWENTAERPRLSYLEKKVIAE